MPEVICNTSVLQYLHQLGLLHLLRDLYGRVTIPQAVTREITAGLAQGVNLPDLAALVRQRTEIQALLLERNSAMTQLRTRTTSDVHLDRLNILMLGELHAWK
ncbi:MAG: hypothetical protein ABI651_03605 [Verrucomicrobiota bacterium]